jgi:5-methylcytosine-specific restriction enzyme subunit McrC
LNGVTIEILPKADRGCENKNFWRDKLMFMLSKVYKLDVQSPSTVSQELRTNSPILDIFIKKLLDEVDALLHQGLVKCYRRDEGNQKSLKGKLLVNKQIQINYVRQERFYVQYTTYDYEHIMNRILCQALKLVIQTSHNAYLRDRANSILLRFPELRDIEVTSETFDTLSFNRKTEDYRNALKLAKLLLLHYAPKQIGHGDNILALMFDMNKLWEEFVYCTLRSKLPDYHVSSQVVRRYWRLNASPTFKTIRPDIVIYNNLNEVVGIIDTKWKRPDKTPSDGDLHQMYVYSKIFDTNKVALLYPSVDEQTTTVKANFLDSGSSCDMLFLGNDQKNDKWCTNLCDMIKGWLGGKVDSSGLLDAHTDTEMG